VDIAGRQGDFRYSHKADNPTTPAFVTIGVTADIAKSKPLVERQGCEITEQAER
jgi:hypothetical protein